LFYISLLHCIHPEFRGEYKHPSSAFRRGANPVPYIYPQTAAAMARSKQPAVKRESSSEYFNKKTADWEKTMDGASKEKQANGHVANGGAKPAKGSPAKNEAGVVQLVIAVAGIYASL
jgi:hypothetical protein